MSKLGLGKGLSSLLGSDEGTVFGEESSTQSMLQTYEIEANKTQPRTTFDEQALEELAQSIREHGIISPLIVRRIGEKYQIIAGERRFRAAKICGLSEIPVRIIEADEKKVAEIALIENLQREDLNPFEEALGYKELMRKHNMTQEQVSKSVGKSRSAIANTTRILNLNDEILDMIRNSLLTTGHARAILSVEDASKHLEFAQYIIDNSLNVRQAEKQAKCLNSNENEENNDDKAMENFENKAQQALCRKVKIIAGKNKKKGKVVLEYMSQDDLEILMETLSNIKM